MKSILRQRPSPALVISLIALFVSLGGVSYGVATGSIDSREIKNDDVRGLDVRESTIRGSDVARNTLAGDDIAESQLDRVPRARTADRAVTAAVVSGFTVQKFSALPPEDSATNEIFRGKDFVLKASCNSAGDPNLLLDGVRGVRPPVVTVFGSSNGNPDDPEALADSALSPGDDLPLATPQRPQIGGTAIVSARNGRVTAIHYAAEGTVGRPFGRRVCSLQGVVITG